MRSCAGNPSCGSFSWNHAKILTVDGNVALVGGHNMWTQDYLLDQPVHDLSMQLRGHAALDAHHFADALWQFVCDHANGDAAVSAFVFRSGSADIDRGCLAAIKPPAQQRVGTSGIPVLAVGRLGAGVTDGFANQNDLARDLMFGAARPGRAAGHRVQPAGKARRHLPGIHARAMDRVSAGRPRRHLCRAVRPRCQGPKQEANTAMACRSKPWRGRCWIWRGHAASSHRSCLPTCFCAHLHLASFRFGPDATWPGGNPIGNHGKFWMVDDRYFYIGSDNIYPVDLQEFGYIVDNRDAAATLLKSYWEPLWRWSRVTAVSGSDAARCVLRDEMPSS